MGPVLSDLGGGAAWPEVTGIAVLGSGHLYTRQSWAHVEAEFNTGCRQLGSLEEALDRAPDFSELQLLIVDERLAEDLLNRMELYRSVCPAATIVFAYRDDATARWFYESYDRARDGAVGFLPMNVPFEVWLAALRLLLHKELFLPGCLVAAPVETAAPRLRADPGAAAEPAPGPAVEPAPEPPAENRAPAGARRLSRLTSREREVLRLASTGTSNKVIARELAISEHTVKLHMHNLSRKLGVSNRTAAASWYVAAGQHDAARRH